MTFSLFILAYYAFKKRVALGKGLWISFVSFGVVILLSTIFLILDIKYFIFLVLAIGMIFFICRTGVSDKSNCLARQSTYFDNENIHLCTVAPSIHKNGSLKHYELGRNSPCLFAYLVHLHFIASRNYLLPCSQILLL